MHPVTLKILTSWVACYWKAQHDKSQLGRFLQTIAPPSLSRDRYQFDKNRLKQTNKILRETSITIEEATPVIDLQQRNFEGTDVPSLWFDPAWN